MKTRFREGMIEVQLTKPETSMMEKVASRCDVLAGMRPVKPIINDAATAARDALRHLIAIAGPDAKDERLPLFDGVPEGATKE